MDRPPQQAFTLAFHPQGRRLRACAAPAARDPGRGPVRRGVAAAAIPPTPRSTRSSRSAWWCRAPRTTRAPRCTSPPTQGVPVLPRGGGTSQCGQTVGAALVIDNSKYLNHVLAFDQEARTRHGAARHRARPPERVPEAARPVVPGRRLDQRAGDARRHGGQQLLRLALDPLRQHGAQRAGDRRRAGRRSRMPLRHERPTSRRRDYQVLSSIVHASCEREAAEIDARWPKVLRRVQGYNLDHLAAAARTTSRTCWSARKARSPIRSDLHAQALAAARSTRRSASCHFPTFQQAMESPQHIVKLEPDAVELVDRTMIELARGNRGVPPDRRPRSSRASPTRSCWSSSPATIARRSSPSSSSWSS